MAAELSPCRGSKFLDFVHSLPEELLVHLDLRTEQKKKLALVCKALKRVIGPFKFQNLRISHVDPHMLNTDATPTIMDALGQCRRVIMKADTSRTETLDLSGLSPIFSCPLWQVGKSPSAGAHESLASKSLQELMQERAGRETKKGKVSYFAGPFDGWKNPDPKEGYQKVLPRRCVTFRIRMVESGNSSVEVNLIVIARNSYSEPVLMVEHTFKDSCPSEAVFRLDQDLASASLRFTATDGKTISEKEMKVQRDQAKWEDVIKLCTGEMYTVKIAFDIDEQPSSDQEGSFLSPRARYAHTRLSWSTYQYHSDCWVRLECDTPRFTTSLQELVRTCIRECPQLKKLRLPVPVEAPTSAEAVQAYMQRLALKYHDLIAKAESVCWTEGTGPALSVVVSRSRMQSKRAPQCLGH